MQSADCDTHLVGRVVMQVGWFRREEGERVVAPVIAQSLLHQPAVVHERVHGQQFDRGYAKPAVMLDHRRCGEAGEGAAFVLGDPGVLPGQATHMGLVDDGVGPGDAGRTIVAPVEGFVGDDAFRHGGRAVAPVERQVAARRWQAKAVQRVGPAQVAGQCAGVGVEQELVGIEAVAARRVIGTVGAVAIQQAGGGVGQVAVPDLVGVFGQGVAGDLVPAGRFDKDRGRCAWRSPKRLRS